MKTVLRHILIIALAAAAGVPLAQQQGAPQPMKDSTAMLNLNDADIRVLINTVSEATGKNFIVDPRVKAKVTVVSAKPMSKSEIYEVFLSILDVHGFSAVPSGDVFKIVPDVNAKQGAVPTGLRPDNQDTDQLVTQVIQLQNISANQLVPILRPLVPQQGHLAAYSPTNVLVITDRASNIKRLIDVIHIMDRADTSEIEIVKLKNASAGEIVRIVTALQQAQNKDAGAQMDKPTLTADERTNSVLITGDRTQRQRLIDIIAQLDSPLETTGNTKVIFLKYGNAKDLVSILQGVSAKTAEAQGNPQGGGGAAAKREGVDIQADEANNALVITAQPAVIQELEAIVRQLDIPRAQVLIEAVIAEVSSNLASELGAQFAVDGGANNKSGPVAAGIFGLAGTDLTAAAGSGDNKGSAAAGLLGEGINLAFGKGGDSNRRWGVLLRALKGDAATNILSTPTLVTMDNVEAEIVVGQNVPFVTGSFSNTGGTGVSNPFQTIQRQDVGLTLKIKPQINEGDAIKLEIEQETSAVESSTVASDVITNKRSIKTQVLVRDGQTIVLGGLIRDEFQDQRQKVPFLGSIPLLGRLFSYTKTEKKRSNLMVFIRPVILLDEATTDYFTSQKYNLIQARQLEAEVDKRGLIKNPNAVLPDIEVLFVPRPQTNGKTPDKQPAAGDDNNNG